MARTKIILDTDPGVDDVLALLLALASPELEILAITTVHGNINLTNTTRNTLSLFNALKAASETTDPSVAWTKALFEGKKITLAAGAVSPLNKEKQLDAAYFHGRDGLGGVSDTFPQYLPSKGWESSFPALRSESLGVQEFAGVTASQRLAHDEMIHILESEPEDTVTIVAVGPLTNLSLACTTNYASFSRVKEIVIMGGALAVPGNATPTAEFNILADPEAAAHLFSFTSPTPSSTYHLSPESVAKRLQITLLPLDTTTHVCLSHPAWYAAPKSLLSDWCNVFLSRTFETMKGLYKDSSIEKINLSMHDPACIWYLTSHSSHNANGGDNDGWVVETEVDVRIETEGRWTRGSCVLDFRGRERIAEGVEDVGSDQDSWLSMKTGNRLAWVSKTPGSEAFVTCLMGRVFGSQIA